MLRGLIRFLLALFLLAMGVLAACVIYCALTPPQLEKAGLREGDLVFQTLLHTQDYAVMFATASPYSHVGFVHMEKTGEVIVEAVGPVKETPLSDWVSRGAGQRVTVMRIRNLTPVTAQKAFSQAQKEYGKPYDIYFLKGDNALYCSELVRLSFGAAGVTLGQMQKVSELHGSTAMDEIIRQRWQSYPLCKGVKGMTFEKCHAVIMQQELVTPASIANDAKLQKVYSNYPLD